MQRGGADVPSRIQRRYPKPWNLYWVESDGFEDCFVAARNSRSACSVEIHMNGFDPEEVCATKILQIPPKAERVHRRDNPDTRWPGYVYGKKFFENIGAELRVIDGQEEMLLSDVVYDVEEYAPCAISRSRSIGIRAIDEIREDPFLGSLEYDEEDIWSPPEVHLITGLGMCLASCQLIEYYIVNSFLLGISKGQKKKYETLNDLKKGWKGKTLGGMMRSIEEAWEIEEPLRSNIILFIRNRNILIHGITTEERYDIRTSWGQRELISFLYFFDVHARIVKLAFRASYYASIEFAIQNWGVGEKLPRDVLRKKQKDEIGLFFQFFKPKEDAI